MVAMSPFVSVSTRDSGTHIGGERPRIKDYVEIVMGIRISLRG